MEVFVDDRRVDAGAIAVGTLEDALRQVQATFCTPDRLVIRLRCDGRDVLADAMSATLRREASSLRRLDVFTCSRGALVIDALTQASATLTDTEAECERAAELLTEGKTAEGIQSLGECLGVWQQIHQAVAQSIQILRLDMTQTRIHEETLADLISRPKEVLTQVKQALQVQDHVLLADILQYEFTDVSAQWHGVIAGVRTIAEQFDKPAK